MPACKLQTSYPMRRWLIRHEQIVMPFVVDADTICAATSPDAAAGAKFQNFALIPDQSVNARKAGLARVDLAGQSLAAHYNLTTAGADIVINGFFYRLQTAAFKASGSAISAQTELRAEIPGRIVKIRISAGDTVEAGDVLIVQEAMKTEMSLKATARSRVREVLVSEGAQVDADAILVAFEAAAPDSAGA